MSSIFATTKHPLGLPPIMTSLPSTPHANRIQGPMKRLWSSPTSDYFSSNGEGEDHRVFSPAIPNIDESLSESKPSKDSKESSVLHESPIPERSAANLDSTLAASYTLQKQSQANQPPRSPVPFLLPEQRALLARLQGIIAAIVKASSLTEHHVELLHADIDRLEVTLSGPDPQSREPADTGDSGLFSDDDDEAEEEYHLEPQVEEDEENEEDETILEEEPENTVEKVPIPTVVCGAEIKNAFARVTELTDQLRLRLEETKASHSPPWLHCFKP
jgi:hypothetical protein